MHSTVEQQFNDLRLGMETGEEQKSPRRRQWTKFDPLFPAGEKLRGFNEVHSPKSPASQKMLPDSLDTLNQFQIQEKAIGSGSYGKVRLGFDTLNNRRVALKFISKASMKKPSHFTRVKREVRILKLLDHPHIVKLHQAIETTEDIVLVMEHVSGGELFDLIVKSKRMNESQARIIFRQMISALEYCHGNCVIHRDLKPENVLLDSKGNAKIIDFGFANTFNPDGRLGTFCGSPYYASPEMIGGKAYIGPEVDIWSLGVTLYAMICGKIPFEDESNKILYEKIQNGQYSIPDHVSPQAQHLIRRMLTVDSKLRASIPEIKTHPWTSEGGAVRIPSYLPYRSMVQEPEYEIMSQMSHQHGYEYESAKRKVMTDPSSPEFACYYLIKERRESKHYAKEATVEQFVETPKSKRFSFDGAASLMQSAYSLFKKKK